MTRKAKIIATLGNSTEGILEEIVARGADAVLIDTYYGSTEECIDRINKIKELRDKLDKNTAIIYDLDHIYAESKYKLIKIEEENVHFACQNDVDFVACPFVSNLDEIRKVKDILQVQGKKDIGLIVKIDCKEAYENIDEIIQFADSIMINRDELGMELPYQNLPSIQKEIIRKANDATVEETNNATSNNVSVEMGYRNKSDVAAGVMMHIGGIYNLKGEYHYAASEGCFGIANSDKFSSNAYTNKILDSIINQSQKSKTNKGRIDVIIEKRDVNKIPQIKNVEVK